MLRLLTLDELRLFLAITPRLPVADRPKPFGESPWPSEPKQGTALLQLVFPIDAK